MTDDDIRQMVREFRVSVATDLEAQHRRLTEFGSEMRSRQTLTEVTILNEFRALSDRLDQRLSRIETRLTDLDGRV